MGKVGRRTATAKAQNAVRIGNKFDVLASDDDDDEGDESEAEIDKEVGNRNARIADVVKKAKPNKRQIMKKKVALAETFEEFEDNAECDWNDGLARNAAEEGNARECDCWKFGSSFPVLRLHFAHCSLLAA